MSEIKKPAPTKPSTGGQTNTRSINQPKPAPTKPSSGGRLITEDKK
jgi:hypothetical protein